MPRTKAKETTNNTTKPKRKNNVKPIQTRDERGVRIQAYRRFKEGVDYIACDDDIMIAMAKMAKERIMGRPPKFSSVEELQAAICDYWEYIIKNRENGVNLVPDVEGVGAYIGVSRETLNQWKNTNYQNFADTIKQTYNQIAAVKKQMAVNGKIPPIVFATDFNNNHGYTQKQEVVVTPNNPLGDQLDGQALEDAINALPDSTD